MVCKREIVPVLTEIEDAVENTEETEAEDKAAVSESAEAILKATETETEISAEEDRI